MPRTQRGLKKARSKVADRYRKTKFTVIVEEQEGVCWFCNERMGGDCSREHLFSQVLGGTNDYPLGNLKAAHKECNSAAGHLPVKDKLRLREIGHSEGRKEMLHVALQMRRADARIAFSAPGRRKPYNRAKFISYWKKLGLESKPDWWDEI